MIELQWTPYRKARIWYNDLPESPYRSDRVLRNVVVPARTGRARSRQVAVELRFIVGPRTLYGLLGATYQAAETDNVEIVVPCSDAAERPADVNPGDPQPGLLCEYSEAVISSLSYGCRKRLGGGVVIVTAAAHTSLGSSVAVFGRLGAIVAELLTAPSTEMSHNELVALIKRVFGRGT